MSLRPLINPTSEIDNASGMEIAKRAFEETLRKLMAHKRARTALVIPQASTDLLCEYLSAARVAQRTGYAWVGGDAHRASVLKEFGWQLVDRRSRANCENHAEVQLVHKMGYRVDKLLCQPCGRIFGRRICDYYTQYRIMPRRAHYSLVQILTERWLRASACVIDLSDFYRPGFWEVSEMQLADLETYGVEAEVELVGVLRRVFRSVVPDEVLPIGDALRRLNLLGDMEACLARPMGTYPTYVDFSQPRGKRAILPLNVRRLRDQLTEALVGNDAALPTLVRSVGRPKESAELLLKAKLRLPDLSNHKKPIFVIRGDDHAEVISQLETYGFTVYRSPLQFIRTWRTKSSEARTTVLLAEALKELPSNLTTSVDDALSSMTGFDKTTIIHHREEMNTLMPHLTYFE